MKHSPDPLRLDYWLGTTDPRPLAIFRVVFGMVLLHDLVDLTFDLRAFLTDDGILPRGVDHADAAWSVFNLVGSLPAVCALYAVGVAAVIAFTVGFHTRVATALSFVFLASLHNRNLFVTDAGDDLARILMFWSIFADLGACWSVDAARSSESVRPARALGLRLLQGHIVLLYAVAGLLKWRLGWGHGTAIYGAMQLRGFLRPAGALLGTSPFLCRLSTYAILSMELSFPIAALSPFFVRPARALAVALGVAIQLGIFVTMRVGVFTELMLGACVLFVLPEWMDAVERSVRARLFSRQAGSDASLTFSAAALEAQALPRRGVEQALACALVAQFAVTAWDPFLNNRVPLPAAVKNERRWLDLDQPFDLFGQTYEIPSWHAVGQRADGTQVDVLSVVAPHACDTPRMRYSRWNKLTYKWHERPMHYDALGAYFCRRYDEAVPGAPLDSFTLTNDVRMPVAPGGAPSPVVHEELERHHCAAPIRQAAL